MFHIELVDAVPSGKRIHIQLQRIPAADEFIVVGEDEYRVIDVHLMCGDDGVQTHSWIQVLKTPADI